MANKKTTFKFQKGDIVKISPDYRSSLNAYLSQPDIQVYEVMANNEDGTIKLDGVLTDIPAKFVEGVPIDDKLTEQIYYDNIFLARSYEIGKVRNVEDISARKPFMVTIEESMRNTPLWEAIQRGEFRFVHELQHWIEKNFVHDRIRINHFWQ